MSQHIPYYDILATEISNTDAIIDEKVHEKVKAYIGKFCLKIDKLDFDTYPNYNKLKGYV